MCACRDIDRDEVDQMMGMKARSPMTPADMVEAVAAVWYVCSKDDDESDAGAGIDRAGGGGGKHVRGPATSI